MEQGLVKKETLVAIGNSIRAKNGTQDTYTPAEMPSAIDAIEAGGGGAEVQEITITSNGTYTAPEGIGYSPVNVNVPQDGAPTAEELTVTGDCTYRFANDGWNWVLNKYGSMIISKDISNCERMFENASPKTGQLFAINGKAGTTFGISVSSMFSYYSGTAETLPELNIQVEDMSYMFTRANSITEIPERVYKNIDYSKFDNPNNQYASSQKSILNGCYRLRKLPYAILQHGNPNLIDSSTPYEFEQCFCLDEIIDLPNPYYNVEWKSNAFGGYSPNDFTEDCSHLKDLTFAPIMTNGEPNNPKWSNQIVSLINNVGYGNVNFIIYGLPAEKEIKDDATYQQFKNDNDAWTHNQEYSRYNHDSAVRTINSLPDTSAFIASNGGTNTIKFAGDNGSKTDGGAISTLTPEEIAVATAKGWTVTLV